MPWLSIMAARRAARPSFFRGTGAVEACQSGANNSNQVFTPRALTSAIFLDVKLPQQVYCLISTPAALGFESILHISTVADTRVGNRDRRFDKHNAVDRLDVAATRRWAVLRPIDRRGARSWFVYDCGPRNLVRNRAVGGRGGCGGSVGGVGIHVYAKDATCAAKLVVDGAEVDLLDAKLSEHGGAHDTGLDSDV